MSISPISSASAAATINETTKSAPAPTTPAPAALPADTVSISSAAQKVAQAGDVDHDGDSH